MLARAGLSAASASAVAVAVAVAVVLAAAALVAAAPPARAEGAAEAYAAMGLEPTQVLSGTTLNVKVVPGDRKQLVLVTSYMTGKRDRAHAVNVRLDVFQPSGSQLLPVFSRDFGALRDGFVSDGNLEIFDLDGDGVSEIVVSFADHESPVIRQRVGEIVDYGRDGFFVAWSGPLEYDATQAAREVPEERRDRYDRELDLGGTLRTRGESVVFRKTVIAVAGERLAQPQVVEESYPLRSAPADSAS